MRHVDERDADLALDALQLELHRLAELEVERAERLVEQQGARVVDQRPRERDTLLLATGQLTGLAVGEVGQPHDLEKRAHPLRRLTSRHALRARPEGDVVEHRHVGEERVVLEDRVDVALVRGDAGNVLAFEGDAPG